MSLMAALQLPIVLTKLSYLIDNPWAVSLDRATAAGLILADSLIDRNLGTRPVTLVGYSLGSRVIFSCLQELARKGAYGLVQNVYLFGSPIVVRKDDYVRARTVVPGRFVNGYNRNDWILGYLFRLTNGGIRRVAGLASIEGLPWIENVDVTALVAGHMQYRRAMPRLLRECGWTVESDEFTEIEDPDPDNHAERQRELINEIEEARKGLELEKDKRQSSSKGGGGGGGMFAFLGRKKRAEKQEWEIYGDGQVGDSGDNAGGSGSEGNSKGKKSKDKGKCKGDEGDGKDSNLLFDVDAIRAELAREVRPEDLSVREIPSTLPPMKLHIRPTTTTTTMRTGSQTRSQTGGSLTPGSSPTPVSGASPAQESIRVSREQTPSSQASASYYGARDDDDDDGSAVEDKIEMSFEPPQPQHAAATTVETLAELPDLGTASKMVANISMPDPWADLDDEDFGKEQEISMTFA